MKTRNIILVILISTFIYKLNGQNLCFEVSLNVQQMVGDITSFDTEELLINDFLVYGFGAGMNAGRLNLNMDFLFGATDLEFPSNEFKAKISCVDINADWSFLKKPFTPLLTAGIGSLTFSESFTSAEGLNETDFAWNAGGGIKWTISDMIVVKALYRVTSTRIKESDNAIYFNGFSLGIGYRF